MSHRFISLFALLAGVLLFAAPVSAQFEPVGGVTYNTYAFDFPAAEDSGITKGIGFFGGAQYWVTPTLAIGGQYERLTASGTTTSPVSDLDGDSIGERVKMTVDPQISGFLATAALNVPLSGSVTLRPFGGAGLYTLTADITATLDYSDPFLPDERITGDLEAENRFGGKVGIQVGTELASGFILSVIGAYRFVGEFDDATMTLGGFSDDSGLEGWNVNGFSAGASISYAF